MGVRSAKREELRRLASKSLDAQFTNVVRDGLGCAMSACQAFRGSQRDLPSRPAAR